MNIETIESLQYKDYKVQLPTKIKVDLDQIRRMHEYMSGSDLFLYLFKQSVEKYKLEQLGEDTNE